MKIAVTSSGSTLDSNVEARFGRCPFFLLIDLDTHALEAIPNPNIALAGGAGPQSAQLMADKGGVRRADKQLRPECVSNLRGCRNPVGYRCQWAGTRSCRAI